MVMTSGRSAEGRPRPAFYGIIIRSLERSDPPRQVSRFFFLSSVLNDIRNLRSAAQLALAKIRSGSVAGSGYRTRRTGIPSGNRPAPAETCRHYRLVGDVRGLVLLRPLTRFPKSRPLLKSKLQNPNEGDFPRAKFFNN